MRMGNKYQITIILLLCYVVSFAQTSEPDTLQPYNNSDRYIDKAQPTPFIVGTIYITGNRRTKSYIVERELPFKSGDSIFLPDLVAGFETARRQLFNTGLFNEVVVSLKSFRGYVVDVNIELKERWYIFPLPYVKPVDRNLVEWGKQGYSTDRLNYGFKFTWYNFTGRNDKLRLWLITGYTKQLQFQYDQPYADKTLKHGYRIGFMYSSNKEVNYSTSDNQQQFIDSLKEGIQKYSGYVDYTYRPGLRTVHAFRLSYTKQIVDSQVLHLNPKYFGPQHSSIEYPEISYTLNYVNVDYIHFPLTGIQGSASLLKRGFHADNNMWELSGKFFKGWKIGKKFYFGWQANAVVRLPFDQPYINQRLFGYGDLYLRGLEKYVVDGVAAALSRQTFRREMFRFSIPTFIRSKTHDKIPFRIYARTFGDMGYAYNKNLQNNSLVNKMLYTGGFGVDIVTFYDFIFRFDYSFNQLGQKGLFLHIKNEF
jgi:outer membrane protein assembly factor BamA